MRWSAWFLRFSLRIAFIADLRRFLSCFIFFFLGAEFFAGLGMLAEAFGVYGRRDGAGSGRAIRRVH